MAIFNTYFYSCVLLLLTVNARSSSGLPVRALSLEKCKSCSTLFGNLLEHITELLNNDTVQRDVFHGVTTDEAVVRSKSDTPRACSPNLTQNPACMMQRNSSFSESECLSNIMKDLGYYAAVIDSYLNNTLLRDPVTEAEHLRPTLGMIESLRKNCSLMPDEEEDSSKEEVAQLWGDNSFENRKKMYRMMRGFYVRTITINRAMGYIASGDHRK
ncbi:interleukin-12 subunit alpha [Xyrichtys novacula]|uniref:Interleukin-12 subunit alpha n=1 Tax=Xyrichtys novacula TaxID=13765 RepID=A0AAV1FW73_XYRNO|nr:interleukin-12 subunit alpha [Xyrichtys novacula]